MALTDQGENIEAIERYFGSAKPQTLEASRVRDEFQRFASGLGDFERNFEQQAYDRARNFRLEYNRANAVTEREREAVEEQALRGLSTEQLEDKADRRKADGTYVPPPSGSGEIGKVAAAVGFGLVLLLLLRR